MRKLFVYVSLCLLTICLTNCSDSGKEPTLPNSNLQEGALCGEFSVSKDKKVHFSKGNLSYLPKENRFRFQEQQYDRCPMIHNVYTVDRTLTWEYWIDLFFWGTSGWQGGVTDYRPGTRNNENSYFYINNDMHQGMYSIFADADWGVYNKIENGGNIKGVWRTLSADEILYLFSTRDKALELFGFGYACGVYGMFILPDNFLCPKGLSFKSCKETGTNPIYNKFSKEDFATLENAGVVFLPGCGRANYLGGTIIEPTPGWYWTSSTGVKNPKYAQMLYFDEEKVGLAEGERNYGHSVRLVCDIK